MIFGAFPQYFEARFWRVFFVGVSSLKPCNQIFQIQILRFFSTNKIPPPLPSTMLRHLPCRRAAEIERYRERHSERERESARGRQRERERQREIETPIATATSLPSFSAASYRGTSLTRKRTPPGPYCRPMPRVLRGS
jgi:hypothetical protein